MGMELAMAWCFLSSFIGGKWYQTNLGWSLQCLDVRCISLHRFHWWVSRMTGLSLVCLWTVGSWWESMWALKTTKLLTPVGYLIFRLIFFCLHLTREEGCPGTDGCGESKADSCRVCNAEEERNPEGGSSFFCPIDFGALEPLKHLKPTMVEISHCWRWIGGFSKLPGS